MGGIESSYVFRHCSLVLDGLSGPTLAQNVAADVGVFTEICGAPENTKQIIIILLLQLRLRLLLLLIIIIIRTKIINNKAHRLHNGGDNGKHNDEQ